MGWKSTYLLLFVCIFTGWRASAQLSCQYTLELEDTFGDGWNGAALDVNINGTVTTYTLDPFVNPDFASFALDVSTGDIITLSYTPGDWETEVIYRLFDADGLEIFTDGPNPATGPDVFSTTGNCPTCPVPAPGAVSVVNIRAFYVDIRWTPSDPTGGSTLIEYGSPGFAPGTGSTASFSGGAARLQPLQEYTEYDFYLRAICSNGDTSVYIGPYAFRTRRANDVGVIAANIERVGCNLFGNEVIDLTFQNFGGLPQTFIPYNFTVNGVPGGVPQPQDGLYTGVLGIDSTFTTEFETTYDFSEPGEYLIQVFTQLEGDSDPMNDTITFTLVTLPFIQTFPYVEGFEAGPGGWTVDANSLNSSWEFGVPAGGSISAAANGQQAWVTNLDGNYNDNELSFLQSPCMNFSSFTEDPVVSFSLNFSSEECCDEGWLEVSTDDGETWSKVLPSGVDFNWYNDQANQWWDGSGGFSGWTTASTILTGMAGEAQVRLRFVFSSNFFTTAEGMGIDDIRISARPDNDLLPLSARATSSSACGNENFSLSVNVANPGTADQTNFTLSYQVNGGDVLQITLNENIPAGGVLAYNFADILPGLVEGPNEVLIWTGLAGDENIQNDTFNLMVSVAPVIDEFPYTEGFELFDGGWSVGPNSVSSTWAYGQPTGILINAAAEGDFAWVTNLAGTYNNNELGYLVSPCMDFSSLDEDPRISFSLFFDSESCCDEGWLEVSINGGNTWTKVGTAGSGLNWYNDSGNQWWDGTGGFTGWVVAQNVLTGTANQAQVRLRFVFSTDGSVVREGMGVDNVRISPQFSNDLIALSGRNAGIANCGFNGDQVTLTLTNAGMAPQTTYDVSYQVNGGPVVTETVVGTIAPGAQLVYTFMEPFNSSNPGAYTIRVWTDLATDEDVSSDTTTFTFNVAAPNELPLSEDFEATTLPAGWITNAILYAPGAHNNPTRVLGRNLFSPTTNTLQVTTPVYGRLAAEDSLFFDYRYTIWSAGTEPQILGANDRLEVQISNDCGLSFTTIFTINSTNHVPSATFATVGLPLVEYAGQNILVRLLGTWGSGDYWLDLDNININGSCRVDLALDADITPASGPGIPDGSATVFVGGGEGPFTYLWSTGATTATISGLEPGIYTVEVTDNGCTDQLIVEIPEIVIGTDTPDDRLAQLRVAPNPTQGLLWIDLTLPEPTEVVLQLINLLGQPVWQSGRLMGQIQLAESIDLSGLPAGTYLLRVQAGNQARTLRVVKTN